MTGAPKRALPAASQSDALAWQMRAYGIECETEHKFHETRRWRLDVAVVGRSLAIEIEGGVWTGGRHTRPTGFLRDAEKYNALAIAGWRLLRVTPAQVKSGEALSLVERALMGGSER